MPINASLFAHIENDSSLAGTYALQGNRFAETVDYLSHFINSIVDSEFIPPAFTTIQKQLHYLVQIEQKVRALWNNPNRHEEVLELASAITKDIRTLSATEKLLLPGGWLTQDDGHAMIYQFTFHPEGYHFTVVNAGEGLDHHDKKSVLEKELYNPSKTWYIPVPQTRHEQQELVFFIKRLLSAYLPYNARYQKQAISTQLLYEEILPSISYVNGREISTVIPEYGYTGGQLSGTCAQRVIHQLLKINSISHNEYLHFIFKFKQHALFDYAQLCFAEQQPFNAAVADQINLAIINNFKILNTPRLFNSDEMVHHQSRLIDLQQQLSQFVFKSKQLPKPSASRHTLAIESHVPIAKTPSASPQPSPTTGLKSFSKIENGVLNHLRQVIEHLTQTQDPAARFLFLQQLFLELPIDFSDNYYVELRTQERLQSFQQALKAIQSQILALEQTWLNKEQIPLMNVMLYCLMSLHIDTYTALQKKKAPSFAPFSAVLMNSLLGHQSRNAFMATNHPEFDKRLGQLRQRVLLAKECTASHYYQYYNELLDSESPHLKAELTSLYQKHYGNNSAELHCEIKNNKLEALFMIAQHYNQRIILDEKFQSLILCVNRHLDHEERLRELINPFYVKKYGPQFSIAINHNTFRINTGLFPIFVPSQTLLTSLALTKYSLKDSPAKRALEADNFSSSIYMPSTHINPKSANAIQLYPSRLTEGQLITSEAIIERDYFHLRSEPSLQIALTLDYFTNHIARCAEETNQRYIEANLFQPGLLLEAIQSPEFLLQLDRFITTGNKYFTEHGQQTTRSMFLIRINYLVSRYLSLSQHAAGSSRLQLLRQELDKQRVLTNPPEVIYALNQYLLLTLIECMAQGDHSVDCFYQAYSAYVYLQGHINPQLREDKTHRIDTECAIAQFKLFIANQSEAIIKEAVHKALGECAITAQEEWNINGHSPLYRLSNTNADKEYIFNSLTGKLYQQGMAHHQLPANLQQHPLLQHLGLQSINECLINVDDTYLTLTFDEHKIHLFHKPEQITVQKEWTINKVKSLYELQALTSEHWAYYANKKNTPIKADLPQIFMDGSMNYWKNTDSARKGLLVQNNSPIYSVTGGSFWALDKEGNETGYQLIASQSSLLNYFESSEFLISQQKAEELLYSLPRYNLQFTVREDNLFFLETGEQVIPYNSPIAPEVAGLLLSQQQRSRYLVPVARFYATEKDSQISDFYPTIHDIDGTIARICLEDHWQHHPPVQKPLWHFQNSERYVSYQLNHGEPIAEQVADALYLVYLYLATHQTAKAWKLLEECSTRLGGLSGDLRELEYITWICLHLPHLLPCTIDKSIGKKPTKATPPYVACQLKTLSLLCEFLSQNRSYPINIMKQPVTANEHYQQLQQQEQQHFLTNLPATIYQLFTRLQRMRRHLAYTYVLSPGERKHLLGFYNKSQPQGRSPQGALGAEWLSLSLESLLAERDTLQAHYKANQALGSADKKRLEWINQRLNNLKPIKAISSALELVDCNLTLPLNSTIQQAHLKESTRVQLEQWHHCLPGPTVNESIRRKLITALHSEISEDEFILNFPAYLQQALSISHVPQKTMLLRWVPNFIYSVKPDPSNETIRKKLMNFCSKTLLAARHVPLAKQSSNIPLLCIILYRVLNNASTISPWFDNKTYKFNDFIKSIASLPIPPLCVYQAKDEYKAILLTPEEFITQQEQRPKRTAIILNNPALPPLLQQTGVSLHLEPKEACLSLIDQYHQRQKTSQHQLKELEPELHHGIKRTLAAEEKAGSILFKLAEEKKKLALALMQHPELRRAVDLAQHQLQTKREAIWNKALVLANEGPTGSLAAKGWAMEQCAQSKPVLTQAHLFSFYCQADLTYYLEKTGLSREKAQHLHHLIHQALVDGIKCQMLNKINQGLCNPDDAAQALDLLSRAEIPGLNEPSIILLQHEEQIILHHRQATALHSLLSKGPEGRGFNETIEKIIMGGGKSKVILPILAQSKAEGDNLVILEVPQALLATNYVDLNRTSQRLFGKRAYRFEFNRDSDSSPERLEQIYLLFTEIMTTRSYLVTTGEAIKSLELKYIELLLSEQKRDKQWKQQVYWCDKITQLLRHHGDCLIDEVHQGLSIKQRLNYTSGEPKALAAELIKNTIDLFHLIDQEFIEQAPSFDGHYDWQPFKIHLTTKLINQPQSPLNSFVLHSVLRYGTGVKEELIAYLSNQAQILPEAVAHASTQEQASLAFFKQQITGWLPQTLPQQLDKHYGASKRPNLSAVEKTLAIPYAASNIPNERNRFANELEAANKSVQMMLIKGINKELLIERIVEWQSLAHQELFQSPSLQHLDETPTAKGFALLTKGLQLHLSKINTHDAKHMDELHQRVQFNRPLIFDVLRESTLRQIQQDKAILASDNFNHADQFRSVQGVSGTPPWNNTTYHHRLRYDKTSSMGTDGYIIEVIRHKKPVIKGVDFHNAQQFITTLLSGSQNPAQTRAIIDVKGSFTGVSNCSVAQELVQYIKANASFCDKNIKHVLYFNEEQVLCAIAMNKPEIPILLGTSDTKDLNRLLDSTPEERFTYFDQIHATGTDISQHAKTHALVIIDDKNVLHDLLQGSMRLRQLEADQTLELIVPEFMKSWSFETLYQQLKENDEAAIFRDAPSAAKGQMRNLIRRHLLSIIQDYPSEEAEKKAALMQHFRSFFEDTPSSDLFALYGALHKKQAITRLLSQYQNKLCALWQAALSKAQMSPYQKDIEAMHHHLEQIITKALPFCLPEYDCADDSFALEVEVKKEVQHEVLAETLTQTECYDLKAQEEKTWSWLEDVDYSHFFSQRGLKEKMTLKLNVLCKRAKAPNLFSDNLHTSINYARTRQNQTQYLDFYLKPVLLIWYHLDKNGLHATIVTPQEATQLTKQIEHLSSSWLATTQDTVVAGTRPAKMLDHVSYQLLREQVRFFNGELSSLLTQETPLIWLKENPVAKLKLFAEQLAPLRPGSLTELRQLQQALTQGNAEGFAYICMHPFEDLRQFNWVATFPKTIPTQAIEYQKLAEAFAYLNDHWREKNISLEHVQQQFNLPINSLTYLDTHLKHLMTLKSVLPRLQSFDINIPFLHELSDNDRLRLEECLGVSFAFLYERHQGSLIKKNRDCLVSINALQILRLYPALAPYSQELDSYFEACAQQANSTDLLLLLLATENPSTRLINIILANPFVDNDIITQLLEQRKDFSKELIIALAKRHHKPHINLLLQQTQLDDDAILELVQQSELQIEQFQVMLAYISRAAVLQLVSQQPGVMSQLGDELVTHKALSSPLLILWLTQHHFNSTQLERLLQHPHAISSDVLEALLRQPQADESLLLQILQHPAINLMVIDELIQHPQFTASIAQQIIRQIIVFETSLQAIAQEIMTHLTQNPGKEWQACFNALLIALRQANKHDELIPLLEKYQQSITTELGLNIIHHLGEGMMSYLPVNQLIATANASELERLTKITKPYALTELYQLAQKVEQAPQIDRLLARLETDSNTGELLIRKTNYSGKIGLWNWPTASQLSYLVQRATDYQSLSQALNHPNWSIAKQQSWFNQIQASQRENKLGLTCKNPQQQLLIVLEDLKIKAYAHAINARNALCQDRAVKSIDAAKTAFELYQSLHQKISHGLNNPQAYPAMRQACEQDIQKARGVLEVHRGYKQILLNIVNLLVALANILTNRTYRFFNTNTDSVTIVENINAHLCLPALNGE